MFLWGGLFLKGPSRPSWNSYPNSVSFLSNHCVASGTFMSSEVGFVNAIVLWMFFLMWERTWLSKPQNPLHMLTNRIFLLFFLPRDLHNTSSQRTDGLWFDIMWLGHIFASCFWNWGQMLVCFSGIFMLWPTVLALEKFWNLLKICGLSWPSLTPILRIIFHAFLYWVFSISNPAVFINI